ncbi:MAG: phosphoenolpyruvate--protein phosphotransferase [Proteobacteria bacterium]|nr:phosphoenolpyruvate--protein phosphotransferase [Pseudomonadota bacterium]
MTQTPRHFEEHGIPSPLSGDPAGSKASESATSEPVVVPNTVGLHARPAAALVNAAKAYASEIRLRRGTRDVNAKSLVSIMSLGVRQGDAVQLSACGPDAIEAVHALIALIASGCGVSEEEAVLPPSATSAIKPPQIQRMMGTPAAPGLAVGTIFQVRQHEIIVEKQADDPSRERQRLDLALQNAVTQVASLAESIADPDKAAIFSAHEELLSDPELLDLAISGISHGQSAAYAWQSAFQAYAVQLASLDNEVLAGRANDIRDIGRRVLRLIAGVQEEALTPPDNAILIAEDLTPSETAHLDRNKVLGFCTKGGGASSHVAILARSLGLPAICGIDERALQLANGTTVILDGHAGVLHLHPSTEAIQAIRTQQTRAAQQFAINLTHASEQAITQDGHRIEIVANIGNLQEAREAVAQGAEGVGLLRSEFLYLERTTAPSEEEQATTYSNIAQALGPQRILVLRTLDIGGDKPLPYLPLPPEDNPYLGIRGIRLNQVEPEILRAQVRAALRAAPYARLHIMFPMIATLEEVREARAMVQNEITATRCGSDVKIGIMVEVPSVAVMAEKFAQEADFFSIGTNDLTQYTLAMDRGHPRLAQIADALHPSVLNFIAMTSDGAHKHGKWVGVCGGMASDMIAVPLLIGLGIDELSVSVPSIPAIKAQVRKFSKKACIEMAQKALRLDTAKEVRALLEEFTR